jgi:hypothetical protein
LAFNPRANPIVGHSQAHLKDVAVASLATYGSLRVLNAALSMAEEVEVGGAFFVSGSFQPLRWLEPIDDTVERVASIVFGLAVVASVLSFSMVPVAAVGLLLLAMALFGRLSCELAVGWNAVPERLRRLCGGAGALGFVLALGLPLAFMIGFAGGERLTRDEWREAQATISGIAEPSTVLVDESVEEEDPALWASPKGWRDAAAGIWKSADALFSASVTLAGIALLRLVVMPVLAFALLFWLARAVLRRWR